MISKVAKIITQYLIKKHAIEDEEYQLYHYGLFVLISEIFFFCYCLFVGAILKIVFPSILFFGVFFIIHRFAGGLHVKTELHCLIITLSLFLVGIILVKQSVQLNHIGLMITYIFSSIILIVLSPADTPQKPLSNKEKTLFKKITSLIVVLCIVPVVILNIKKISLYANAITVAVVLQSVSVVCGRLFNKKLLTNNT